MTDRSGGTPRVCIASVGNTYVKRSGNSNYLDNVARLLAASGCELHFLAMTPPRLEQARVQIDADYLAPYRSFAIRGTHRIGRQFLNLDPRTWIAPLRRATRPRRHGAVEVKNWTLPAPSPEALDWAVRRVRAFAPDLLVANYFNAAALFAMVEGPRKAILVHDVLARRVESAREAGVAPDFDENLVAREARAFADADACFAIHEAEAEFLRTRHPDLIVRTVPYALDMPEVDLDAPRAPICLFVGAISQANRDALVWLLQDIWPKVHAQRPEARLRVIGAIANAVDVNWPAGAEKIGYVDNLAAEYAAAAVALAPLRFGSGMKIKVVEGLAHGLPTVATSIGAEGVEGAPKNALRVHDKADDFAEATTTMVASANNSAPRHAARATAAAHYDRREVGQGLLDGILTTQ